MAASQRSIASSEARCWTRKTKSGAARSPASVPRLAVVITTWLADVPLAALRRARICSVGTAWCTSPVPSSMWLTAVFACADEDSTLSSMLESDSANPGPVTVGAVGSAAVRRRLASSLSVGGAHSCGC